MKNSALSLISSYEYGFNLDGFYVRFPTREEARLIANLYLDDLILSASKLKTIINFLVGNQNILEIDEYMHTGKNTEEINMANELWFSNELSFNPQIIRLALEICERPRAAGIVRMSDERQILVHDAVSCTLNFTSPKDATNWTRSQYWYPQDLIDFRRRCEQELSPGGSSTIEHKYLSFEPTKGMNDNTPGNWMEITSRYQLHEISGQYYQLYETLDYKNVEIPAL